MVRRSSPPHGATYRTVGVIPKQAGAQVQVRIGRIENSSFIDVRLFNQASASSDLWLASDRGFTLPMSAARAFADAVLRLEEASLGSDQPGHRSNTKREKGPDRR